jgi:Double-GTPase 2
LSDPNGPIGPSDDGAEAEPAHEPVPEVVAAPSPDAGWVGLGGAKSLTWVEADRVAARHGATIVLVAGNQDSGKTTLLLQLWAQFLRGPFAGYRFAGSETLDAFDDRHYPCRVDSGNAYPDTEHTTDTDMRFLHLRIASATGERHALLMTDLWGELFKDVATGAKVSDRVPVAPKSDKTLVVIDGEEVADDTKREAAMRNAKTLIGALASEDGLRSDAPIMVLLSKSDVLTPKDEEWYRLKVANLVDFAKTSGFTAVEEHRVAARPPDAEPVGLERVLEWMCTREERALIVEPARMSGSGRVFTTGRMAVA